MTIKLPIDFSKEVIEAKKNDVPIVALESTIITHGMPYPDNCTCAQLVEGEVRSKSVVPATIAVVEGRIKVGLDAEQFNELGQVKEDYLKVSRRDLSFALSNGKTGGTTVSATMKIAQLADIPIFATGGIGGVHRGATGTFDISADLMELGKTPVTVICAGMKSILDLPLTLEYLETLGVPVVGYKTNKLPAFYCAESPYKVNFRINSASEIAKMIGYHRSLNMDSGIVITNPIPEEDRLDYDEMEEVIQEALGEMRMQGVFGKDVTPFLLKQVSFLTGDKSLQSNIQLIKNNARLAADIALEMK